MAIPSSFTNSLTNTFQSHDSALPSIVSVALASTYTPLVLHATHLLGPFLIRPGTALPNYPLFTCRCTHHNTTMPPSDPPVVVRTRLGPTTRPVLLTGNPHLYTSGEELTVNASAAPPLVLPLAPLSPLPGRFHRFHFDDTQGPKLQRLLSSLRRLFSAKLPSVNSRQATSPISP